MSTFINIDIYFLFPVFLEDEGLKCRGKVRKRRLKSACKKGKKGDKRGKIFRAA